MKRMLTALLVLAGLGLAPYVASAHHSAAMFDNTRVKDLSGTVKEFQWKNPHVWIQLDVKNAGTNEEWSIEGGSPNTLSRQGWRPTTFAPGAVVSVRVNPMKDGSSGGLFVGAKLADGKTLGNWTSGDQP